MEPIKNSSHFCMCVYMMLLEGGLLKKAFMYWMLLFFLLKYVSQKNHVELYILQFQIPLMNI